MRKQAQALCIILTYTVILVVGTGTSDNPQDPVISSDSKKSLSSTRNENINSLSEFSGTKLENSTDFVSEDQLVPTWTKDIDMKDYLFSSSNNSRPCDYNIKQLVVHTNQTNIPNDSGTEYCISNGLAQKYTKPESIKRHHRSSGTTKLEQAIEKNTKNLKKTNKNAVSSIDTDSVKVDELDSRKLKKNKINVSIWNNARLKNRHRESLYFSYRPVIAFDKIRNNCEYIKIGDKMYQPLIENHLRYCKAVYSEIPAQDEFWFSIVSRTSCMHTKLIDCQAINADPSEYKFIEGLSGYYPDLPGDIVEYMDKHAPIVSDQESIKTEWAETLGDIYVRKPAELKYGINEEVVIYEGSSKYRLLHTAVRMILGLSEAHKDLSNLTTVFIEKTLKSKIDSNHLTVVRVLHEIIEKHKSSNKSNIDEEYAVLYNIFENILHQTCVSPESIVIHLYTEMYKSFVYFYEKAEVCEEILESKKKRRKDGKKYYLLTGKCIIKPQRYLKCTTTIDLNKPASEYKHQITEETNKWSIPSDIQKHYHIHYVDNTKQKYTRVCMPMYSNRHAHTISQTIEYLKRLFRIEKEECIFPYKRNNSGDCKYIRDEEKHKTVKDFTNCDIVFYYIEEEMKENYFTFAEFKSYKKPKGSIMRIPLFLSPLMRSAVSMGPFEEKYKEEHKLVDSMKSMWIRPSIYTYEEKYKAIEYFHVHHYYSNLYIRRDNADVPTTDCYVMDSKVITGSGTATVEWYAKIHNSVDKYTHCILSDELINDQGKYNAFSKAVKTQEYTPDSALYGFGLRSSLEKTSKLDSVGCSTDNPINQKDIANCKLSIVPIYTMSTDKMLANAHFTIGELDKEIKQIKTMTEKPETTEEQKNTLKKKKQNKNWLKYKNKKKLRKIQSQDQSSIKEEFDATSLLLCSFLVLQHSNTRTKSSLGAHNEILDAMTRKYNNSNNRCI